jgi:hypothetical protein
MAYTTPTSPAVGDQVTASIADVLAADIIWLGTRKGGRARTNTAQAISALTVTNLTNNGTNAWTSVEDSGGYVSAVGGTVGPIVIPTGAGGLYLFGVKYTQSVPTTARLCAMLLVNSVEMARFQGPIDNNASGSIGIPLNAGDILGLQCFTTTAASASIGIDIYAYRIGN